MYLNDKRLTEVAGLPLAVRGPLFVKLNYGGIV
jgi:hypothetical protein